MLVCIANVIRRMVTRSVSEGAVSRCRRGYAPLIESSRDDSCPQTAPSLALRATTGHIIRIIVASAIAWGALTQCACAQTVWTQLGKAQQDPTSAEIREKLRNRGNYMTDIKPPRPKLNSSATTPHERGAAIGMEARQPLANTRERGVPGGPTIYGARRPLRKLGIPEPPTLDAHSARGTTGLTPGRTPTPSGPVIPGTTGPGNGTAAPGAPATSALRTPTPKERLNQLLRLGPDGKPLAFQSRLPTLPSVRPIPNRIIGPRQSGDPTLPFDQTMPSVPGRMPLTRPNRPVGALPSRTAPAPAPNAGVQPPAGAPATAPTR